MYKKKVKGITLIETMTSLGIMGIFMLLSFPVIKIIYRTEIFFVNESNTVRNTSRIIEIIEKDIRESGFGNKEYIGKEYLNNGKEIFEPLGYINSPLREEFFKRKAEKGSLIFLEIPYVKNEMVFSKYIIYRFYTGSLEVMECSLLNKKIFVERAENILEEVEGYFEKDGKGIVINLQIRNENGKIKKILRGYEIVGKKYE
ncbi:prepilin-type N-terminal cleavage/methylation domain-containing protein [Fusobacterium ulcerans]|uniref:prepilin-type N-terminal cleavage/methylation domain-containing protein n=1 Tax=Fusobacterium ulcerans TaxID=861 RepID=UPI002E76CDDA|nr:prepilin-type N-terminal cleavage/methylation domain-containing protein [Fusobacterium ulcerans]MEE0137424.1 prepilin-type N-terminal cleavage/methylation domain-containing protein [Fusobacterium ulcerans]